METNKEVLLSNALKHLCLAIDEINKYANFGDSDKDRIENIRHVHESSGHFISQRLHV